MCVCRVCVCVCSGVMDVCVCVEPPAGLLADECSCHCCFEVLLEPTTLPCGHSFCRHCLASCWASGLPTHCPECRAAWQGLPRVNILLRDAVEKLFPADVSRRRQAVRSDPWLQQVLQAFEKRLERHTHTHTTAPVNPPRINIREFYSGVLTALSCVAMVLLVYRALSADSSHETLLSKPLRRWSTDDVTLWVEHLGVWTNQYKEIFHREQIDGRSLSALSDEDLSAAPFMIQNQAHRRIILEELHKLQQLRVTLNLWEYKELYPGKTVFLLVGLRSCPRLTLLYLYLLDYHHTFLPFLDTACPAQTPLQDWPGWHQWAEFLVMYFLLPHQLLAAFAWHWVSAHYWTAGVVIAHATLLSVLDISFYWTLWTRGEMRTLPQRLWLHVLAVMFNSSPLVLVWPLLPLFIINIEIYTQLYISPFLTAALVKNTLLPTDAQQRP
ncbi:bifunctional apoptosis regulator-like isoform X1 [Pimephales promelas]|uniref:bifunctional apoptosis regulator-like isoform X1 n=2 Tax=Pimephales promelas TaxID=90988 RepID=UPI001955E9DF|nr:bifunctional apoptosis regulator-like isoform X1 [Pimephales promelas]XP_039511265.1 bifunctional apoptosis regulator-like isoform X1 [Pimephales promelas]XP_039511266.1 bifunctional apoptosis regulator-like isoform X1 [Pimephales promelas]